MSFPNSIALSYEQAFSTSATKIAPLGTRGTLPDGRVFRMAKAGATALRAGNPVVAVAPGQFSMLNTSHNAEFPASTTQYTTATQITIGGSWDGTSNGVTANDYADGWLLVGSTVGSGTNNIQMLRIKSHTAQDGGTSHTGGTSALEVTLEVGVHPLWDITSSAGAALVKNPYEALAITTSAAANTNMVMGVPQNAVTEEYYFWVQTWGDAIVRMSDASSSALVPGSYVANSITASTTGCCIKNSSNYAGAGQQAIGILRSLGTTGSFNVVNLMISP